MDFQSLVDSMAAMTCVVSVEKKENGYGDIRIVTGNRAYIDSIENPVGGLESLKAVFKPNSLYTDFLPKDLNFEESCYQAAVHQKVLHSYAHPERFDVWFNMIFFPLVPGEGNLCYCTYTMEINHVADTAVLSNVSGELASAILGATLRLHSAVDFRAAMGEVIRDIRLLCAAERCCILLMDPVARSCSVLCEDQDPSLPRKLISDFIKDEFYPIAESWEKLISGSNCLIAKNAQDMDIVRERNPVWYQSLTENDVSSIAVFPLRSGNQFLGYIWATNFDPDSASKIKETLELATFILSAEIANFLLVDKLKVLSSRDMLTGVLNRNEMNHSMDRLSGAVRPAETSVGVLYADLNGLKAVNDTEGHAAGDRLLRDAVCALREVFRDEEIFRAGGDEFVMIVPGATAEEMAARAARLRAAEKHYDHVSFAIGIHTEDRAENVRAALQQADAAMYEDKKQYYLTHERHRPAR